MATVATQFDRHAAAYGGVLAGVSFTLFELVASAYVGQPGTVTTPLRMISATVLGRHALNPDYPLLPAAAVGLVIVLALAVAFSNLFVAIVTRLNELTDGEFLNSPVQRSCAGMVFGVIVWLFIFYGVAPVAGWSWFPANVHTDVALVAYALFFGVPVGWFSVRRALSGPPALTRPDVLPSHFSGVAVGTGMHASTMVNALPRVLAVLAMALVVAFCLWLLAIYLGVEYVQPPWDANSFPPPRAF